MKSVAICHNEARFRGTLKEILAKYLEGEGYPVWSVDSYSSVAAVLKVKKTYDILLLSSVARKDAAAVGRMLRKKNPWIRMIYLAERTEGLETVALLHAHDYLIQPMTRMGLFGAMKESLAYLRKEERGKKLVFRAGVEFLFFYPEDIYSIETMQSHKLHFNGKIFVPDIRMTIGEALTRTQWNGFAQSHRSYIVNLLYVEKTTNNAVYMADGKRIPLATMKAAAFRTALEKFWR